MPFAPLTILYRDEHLIAIHKPAGLMVHRSELDRHEIRFAIQLLREQIGQMVWPVHRLDRGTSGLLLFALTREALIAASRAFEAGEVAKTYLAVVRGWPDAHGRITHPLVRQYDPYERRVRDDQGEAQSALTLYERLATVEIPVAVDRYPSSRYALLRLHPETGRHHQIRRHLKHIAHPIIGDATHGKGNHNRMFQQHFGSKRLLLACVAMHMAHPITGVPLPLETRLDDDFMAVLAATGLPAPL